MNTHVSSKETLAKHPVHDSAYITATFRDSYDTSCIRRSSTTEDICVRQSGIGSKEKGHLLSSEGTGDKQYFECQQCSFITIRQRKFDYHISQCHGKGDNCEKINYATTYTNLSKPTSASNHKRFTCKECDYTSGFKSA